MKEKVEGYIETVLNFKGSSPKQKLDWIFGAIDFAFYAELITKDEQQKLYERFSVLG